MLLIAAPGQGAQTPGFLAPWLELPGFAERLSAWSDLAGCDLVRCGSTADAGEIRDTAVAQPLLVAAAMAAAAELLGGFGEAGRDADATAGHSVGELAAGAIAGVVTPRDALALVRARAAAMARAAAAEPTGMTAVLGGDQEAVLAAIDACGLTPANVNGAGQVVAAGGLHELAALAASPPPGARLRPLSVAGAFHTRYMEPGVAALGEAAAAVAVSDPAMILLSNADGSVVATGVDWLARIVAQVAAPVRWDLCMRAMADLGVAALIELPPAGTLTGLARRGLPGVRAFGLKTPDDLAAARGLLAEHGPAEHGPAEHGPAEHGPADHGRWGDGWLDWRLIVAPLAGTFRAGTTAGDRAAPGSAVATGAELGHVEMRGGSHLVAPSFPATVIEWLVEDGDPVSAGQPLVRLRRRDSE